MKFFIYTAGSRRIIVLQENRQLADEDVEEEYGFETLKTARAGLVEEHAASHGLICHIDLTALTSNGGQ